MNGTITARETQLLQLLADGRPRGSGELEELAGAAHRTVIRDLGGLASIRRRTMSGSGV